MTYKQIESSREVRLWIGQIVVPAVTTAATAILMNPELKQAVTSKCKDVKETIKNKFERKESMKDSNVIKLKARG